MKRNVMKKTVMMCVSICLLAGMIPASALSWGDATHAYISDGLKTHVGHENRNQLWGSLGPDIFNYIFDPALCPAWMADQTHGATDDSFMKVWNAAGTASEKALALGFVSHNELWGADFTAHISGLTFGHDWGYINEKAIVLLNTSLNGAVSSDPQLNPTFGEIFAGIGMNEEQQLIVAHVIVEYAIDTMLVKDVSHFNGQKVSSAARHRGPEFPGLLVNAFAADYAANCFGGDGATAAYIITAAEEAYRDAMISYGRIISRPERIAVKLIAEQIVALAPDFLGGSLPVPEEDVISIVRAAIYASMEVCDDYLTEINATIQFVGENLIHHGISY